MTKLQLSMDLYFSVEPYEKKARLIVYQNKEELVCRKETFKNLESFLQTKEARIFKGRLQLNKINQQIHIEVKGEVIGSISNVELKNMIENCKQVI